MKDPKMNDTEYMRMYDVYQVIVIDENKRSEKILYLFLSLINHSTKISLP